jgi:hypothetical protein
MKGVRSILFSLTVVFAVLAPPWTYLGSRHIGAAYAQAVPNTCPVNMVPVGPICVDQFKASVLSMPPDGTGNPRGNQLGVAEDNYPCSDNGNDCDDSIFAVSTPGRLPARFITWFQAQQACASVGKRLLRNGEWQMAAAGTPDPGTDNGTTDCNVGRSPLAANTITPTGSRSSCVSNSGALDMGTYLSG